jgi:hypothetical protein
MELNGGKRQNPPVVAIARIHLHLQWHLPIKSSVSLTAVAIHRSVGQFQFGAPSAAWKMSHGGRGLFSKAKKEHCVMFRAMNDRCVKPDAWDS